MGETVSILHGSLSDNQRDSRNVNAECPLCEDFIQRLSDTPFEYRLFDKRYVNWIRACLVICSVKKAMRKFANDVVQTIHKNIDDYVTCETGMQTGCSVCKVDKTNVQTAINCPHGICDKWMQCLSRLTPRGCLNWEDTDIQAVKKTPWEIVKLFQQDEYTGCLESPKNDITALLSFMTTCNIFDDCFTDKEHLLGIGRFHEQLLHSESLTCSDRKLNENIEGVLIVLEDTRKLKEMTTCNDMVEKIKQIHDNTLMPGKDEECEILITHVLELKERSNALNRRLNRQSKFGNTTAVKTEYSRIQREAKQIEDVAHKFRCFIDIHLIHEPDVRDAFCTIIQESKEIYLEAERQMDRNGVLETRARDEQAITPGKPHVIANRLCLIQLSWEPPSRRFENSSYEVICSDGISNDNNKTVPCKENIVELETLRGDTEYTFKVRMVSNTEVGPFSKASDVIRTVTPAGRNFLNTGQPAAKSGTPFVYTLQMVENYARRGDRAKLRTFNIEMESYPAVRLRYFPRQIWLQNNNRHERRVLFLGDAGSMKSVLLDDMLNYALGLNCGDGYRFTLKDKDASQTQDPQGYISEYVVYPGKGSRVRQTLALINTPNFEHTNNLDRDEPTVQQFYELFKTNVENRRGHIDAICVSVSVYGSQLSANQRFVIEKALELFGKDLKDNIVLLVSCNHDDEDSCRRIANEFNIPEDNCFVVASQVAYTVRSATEARWKRDMNVSRGILMRLGKLNTCTFQMSKEVLGTRLNLQKTVATLKDRIDKKYLNDMALEHATALTCGYNDVFESLEQHTSGTGETCDEQNEAEDVEKQRQYSYKLQRANQTCEALRQNKNSICKDIDSLEEEINAINHNLTKTALRPNVTSVRDYKDFWNTTDKIAMEKGFATREELHCKMKELFHDLNRVFNPCTANNDSS